MNARRIRFHGGTRHGKTMVFAQPLWRQVMLPLPAREPGLTEESPEIPTDVDPEVEVYTLARVVDSTGVPELMYVEEGKRVADLEDEVMQDSLARRANLP